MRLRLVVLAGVLAVVGCNTGSKSSPSGSSSAAVTATVPAPTPAPKPADGALHLGAPIEASAAQVALADVAKQPQNYTGKTFATTGTVTAVCQHMGCWMEIKDDASAAHIKMAGHGFFVPKTASGRKARVLAKLDGPQDEAACEGEGHEGMSAAANAGHGEKGGKKGCKAEAEAQLGRPLAKLSLVAEGVELM